MSMDESDGKDLYNKSSSDDDEEYEENKGNRLLGFMFGNVDNSGDLDADYLDEDAKEHLSALADKLGSSLSDIDLLYKSPHTPADPLEQDYDDKAENAVDYEDIDEQYEGPEIQAVTEEDYLLPKKEYFSADVRLAALKPKSSVFDDEDYDEEEESDKDPDVDDREAEAGDIASDVLEDKTVEFDGQPGELRTEKGLESNEDVKEADDFLDDPPDAKDSTPLPTLFVDDGLVILRFSEIFAIQETPEKHEKRDRRYFTDREKYICMDASKLVEEDEEAFLKNHSSFNSYVKREEVLQPEGSLLNEDCTGVIKFGDMCDAAPTSTGLVELRKDTCVMGAPFKKELTDDLSVRLQSQSSVDVFLLDQQDWEQNILWDTTPAVSEISEGSNQSSGPDLEGLLITGTESENEQKSVNSMNSKKLGRTDHKMLLHDSTVILESFGSRSPARPQSYSVSESRHHPQLLRLESFSKVNGLDKGDAGGGNLELLDHGDFRRFSKLSLQSRDMTEEGWLDSVIWEPEEAFCKPKLVLNFQDEQMLFEIPDNKDNNCLKLHAGAVVLSRYFPSSDERMMKTHGHKTHSNWQFNISNDKFYMNGKTSQQLQTYTNKGSVHTFRVLHSAPALKLQTMKLKLSNKDIANFHRPKALWYPHDKELVIKEQGKLPTQGPMKIVVKSLGGKGSKLHVDAEEKISSVKAKASKKLDFKSTETVKMFYLGKELEDDKSLAAQNVQPNSLIHLVRTKVHLLPEAQKLPGENKPLRPPGAFRKKSDLSVKDGHIVLMEYCEERPLLLSNVGMGANLCTFYQKSSPEDQTGNSLRSQSDSVGNFLTLEPGDRSPFIGDIRAGSSQSSVETNMYRAPLFPQKVQSTDYLLVRSAKGKLSLRRIDRVAVVGQQEPHMEVMSPGSKNLQTYMGNRLLVYVYREFVKHGLHHRIGADDLSFTFSNLSDAIIRKNMRMCAVLKRDRNGKACWYMRHDFHIPPENELKKMLAPELVCSYESMLSGLYRLKHLGITRLTQPTSISSAMSLLPDEAIALAAASHIERELQITPWNLSNNFVACKSQDRANIERLEITGVGDPSGRGLGFSYVRAAPKAPTSGGHVKKKAAAVRGGTSVTGTDADLRRLSMEAAREVLLKFNVPDEVIAKQTRWHRIAMIRKLSSEQAASGVKVDHTTIGKYARGQRMSFLQLQQQTREKCQEIWDRQIQSLSAFDVDDNESESEANSDLDSFAGDLENLLAAGECEEGEEVDDTSKQGKLDGVKGLKMRRRASQVEAEEEFEDEAAEAAELCRLLMDDNQGGQKKNKKKAKAVGDGAGLFPHSRANNVVSIVEPVKKALVIAKNPIAAQPEVSISGNENTVREATKTTSWQLDSSIGRPTIPTKPKTIKENGFAAGGQAVKVKILGDNLKTTFIKEKKSARENFVCGACGQYGHMRTNKHCPRYRESSELQPENIDKEKGAGKSSSVDQPGPSKLKVKKKQHIPKGGVKIALVESPVGDLSSLKTKGIPLKFRYGGPSDKLADKHGLEAPGSSEQAAASDIDSVAKSALKVDEIVISKKTKPRSLQAESDIMSRSALPAVSDRGRGYVESPKQSVSAQPAIDTDGDQVVSSKLSISVQQPSFSTDRDQPEAHKPRLVIRPPTEREQPQKKIIIRRSEEKTEQDWFSHEESPRFESRKTKRMVELAGFQTRGKQENLKLIEESKNKAREERMWWEEEERRRRLERHREERARRHYEDDVMMVEEPEMKVVEIERYREVIRRDWEEEERQKAKKKKTTKRKQQHEIREDYLDDYSTRRNDGRIRDRDRSAKRRPVAELRHYGADYVPPSKRRRGGEVGLANILERIVETLRENTKVSMLFLKPVTKKEAPDYLDIIERPMDLSTIREKVRRMEYKGRRDFRHDVWQIKYNAHKYNNGRNPGIPPLADELLELCDYLLEEHQEEIADAEAGIQSKGE